MRFSITLKLILAFFGLTLFILVGSLVLSRWSFDRGFKDYISNREQVRLEFVRDALVNEYLSSGGNWETTTQERFLELISNTFPARPDRRSNAGPGESLSGPPPRSGDLRDQRPPPNARADRRGPPPPNQGPPPRGGPPRPGGPPPNQGAPEQATERRGPPTALFDANSQFVAGSKLTESPAKLIRVPVMIGEETVGELRSALMLPINSPQDVEFAQQQIKTSWIIGAVAMVLAAALSMALARGLLAPVRRMVRNVARLSSGDYSIRLAENRNDELGQLMADLDHLGKTLEEQRVSRQRLLADISHELRTPLTVLSGELDALKDGVRNFDADQLHSFDQEVQRLRFLIDDLHELSVSDVGGLRYTFSTVCLGECLESVVGVMRRRANDVGLELGVETVERAFINGDAKRLDQLFHNLLENSIAYTDAPGRIEVSMSLANNRVVVEFRDTAPGAREDECERLFEPLYRREASRSRRTGGTGLGLAICRKIVEAHRGTIVASPSPMGGLNIRIEIPAVSEVSE